MRGTANPLDVLMSPIALGLAILAAFVAYTLGWGTLGMIGCGLIGLGVGGYMGGSKQSGLLIVLGIVLMLLAPTLLTMGSASPQASEEATGIGSFDVDMTAVSGNGTESGDNLITTGIYNSTANTFSGADPIYVNFTIVAESFGGERFTDCTVSVDTSGSVYDSSTGSKYGLVAMDTQNKYLVYINDGTNNFQGAERTLQFDKSTTDSYNIQVYVDLNQKALDPLATYGSVSIPVNVCGTTYYLQAQKTSEVA